MQVKKFETKTMQEALVMIKNQMGPDAIILSVKDRRKGYGLAGEGSFEVTAAVSDLTYRKLQAAQAKLNNKDRERFENSSARKQKEFIDKIVLKHQQANTPYARPEFTRVPYIDIKDEGEETTRLQGGSSVSIEDRALSAEMRIRSAAAEAFKAIGGIEPSKPKPTAGPNSEENQKSLNESRQVQALKREIDQLKSLLAEFKKVPQTFISMHPGANYGLPYELSMMFQKLKRAGVDEEIIVEILNQAKENLNQEQLKKAPVIDAWVAKYILETIPTVDQDVSCRYHAFLGPSGHGKTSVLVKMVSHFVITQKRKVAIVTTDKAKVGATEQLRIFAKILNVPFVVVREASEWPAVDKALAAYDHIFVDYPGLSLKTGKEVEQLVRMLPPDVNDRKLHFVLSVLSKDSDAYELAHKYAHLGMDDVIFTKLDESVQHGLIYNFTQKVGFPLHSFSIGPNIPEDFEAATKERVLDLLFRLTKLNKERGQA